MKKFLATLLCCMMVLGLFAGLTVSAAETTDDLSGTAYIMYADESWTNQYWCDGNANANVIPTDVKVTGEGSYTVALEFVEPAAGLAFTALGIKNGEALFPGFIFDITEIRINGEAIDTGKFYTSSDDKVETRSNIYNAWVSALPDDARCLDGDLTDCTPTAVDPADFASVSKIEVDFTVVDPANIVAAEGEGAAAYIMFADADWGVNQYWHDGTHDASVVPTLATVTGEGSYETSVTLETPLTGMAFIALGIENGESAFPYMIYTVDEVLVDGAAIELAKTYTSSDDGVTTRTNIFNEWVSALPEDARCADGDLTDCTWTAVDPAAFVGATSITVKFTAVQGEAPAAEEPVEEVPVVEYSGTYHAYMGVQTNTTLWIFRNAYDDATYGKGMLDANGYEPFSGLYDTTNMIGYAGTFTDAEITGDGTYTVKLEDPDFQAEEHFSLLFVSTDIPLSDGLVFTDVIVKVNGKTVYEVANGYEDKDAKVYEKFLLQNDWNNDVKDLFYLCAPSECTSIEITFTVSGLGYEAEIVDEPAVEEPAIDEEPVAEGNWLADNAGLVAGCGAALIVIVAGAIVAGVVSSKKKAAKAEEPAAEEAVEEPAAEEAVEEPAAEEKTEE